MRKDVKGTEAKSERKTKGKHRLEKIDTIKKAKKQKALKTVAIIIIFLLLLVIIGGIICWYYYPQGQVVEKLQQIWPWKTTSQENENNEKLEENIQTTQEDKQKQRAIDVAITKFKEMGEELEKSDLEILRIQREGKLYYYISSPENTLEIECETAIISRVNGILVE